MMRQLDRLSHDHCTQESIDPIRRWDDAKHGLCKVSTRRIRDLFRKRIWWKCFYCELEEEVES